MKKTLLVLAAAAMIAMGFTSCIDPVKTTADYLVGAKNGWVLSEATSAPAYEMLDGSFVSDLLNGGYLRDFEADDYIIFKEDGTELINPGKLINAEEGYQQEVAGQWTMDPNDANFILMQVPFFYDDDFTSFDAVQERCEVVSCNDELFRIKCTINDDDPSAKGTYTFLLTYVPNK